MEMEVAKIRLVEGLAPRSAKSLFEFCDLERPDVCFKQPTNIDCLRRCDLSARDCSHQGGRRLCRVGRACNRRKSECDGPVFAGWQDAIETYPERGQIAVQGKFNGLLRQSFRLTIQHGFKGQRGRVPGAFWPPRVAGPEWSAPRISRVFTLNLGLRGRSTVAWFAHCSARRETRAVCPRRGAPSRWYGWKQRHSSGLPFGCLRSASAAKLLVTSERFASAETSFMPLPAGQYRRPLADR
jgi:hypothetical protein